MQKLPRIFLQAFKELKKAGTTDLFRKKELAAIVLRRGQNFRYAVRSVGVCFVFRSTLDVPCD